jgi:uncharacterized membrane protein (DUF2068 family)
MMHRPHNANTMALRTVAVLEAVKGVLGLLVAVTLVDLRHKNPDIVAAWLTRILHISPEGKAAEFLYRIASTTTERNIWMLAAAAIIYAGLRFTEALGLWHKKAWAEWLALISGCVYLPWEIHTLIRHPHLYKWGILLVNLLVIFYMLMLRLRPNRQYSNSL